MGLAAASDLLSSGPRAAIMMTFEFPAQSIHVPDEIFHLLVLQPSGIADGAHDIRGLEVQLSPGLREVDANLALIGRIPTSLDIAERFQPFQHRRKGIGLQEQLFAELPDRLAVLSP